MPIPLNVKKAAKRVVRAVKHPIKTSRMVSKIKRLTALRELRAEFSTNPDKLITTKELKNRLIGWVENKNYTKLSRVPREKKQAWIDREVERIIEDQILYSGTSFSGRYARRATR